MAWYGGAARYSGNPDPFGNNEKRETLRMPGNFFVKNQRKRLNIVAVLIALFSPWVLFCAIFALLSFGLHYRQPFVDYALVLLVFFLGVCVPCSLAASALKRKHSDSGYQPSWFLFLAVTCLLAFVTGALIGQVNYSNYMQKYYNLQHLAYYRDVDANSALGQQVMDAGRIDFKEGTQLDLSRSMGFKNHDVYCVSPIVTKGSKEKQLTLDFWAVGKNCCSGVQADFHCPHFSDREARGVIRLMHDEDRPFYRLAVQQAEATYGMPATHPLFFEWVHDPEEAMNQFAQHGFTNYLIGICAYFLFQIFLTVCATLLFSKLVHV